MIKNLSIKGFKSIEEVTLVNKRVNVFIGEPNAGKSNILEALTLLSYRPKSIKDIIRLESVSNLFTDYDIDRKIEITADNYQSECWIENDELIIESKTIENRSVGMVGSPFKSRFKFDGRWTGSSSNDLVKSMFAVKFYRFNERVEFKKGDRVSLETPDGANLPTVILTNRNLLTQLQEILSSLDFKLVLHPIENRIEIYKEATVTLAFPFSTISDTIRRVFFYLAAIQSNKNSILLLEEPDAHTFPFYTQEIASAITDDNNGNQFFVITHNPYLLQRLVEKTAFDDLQVNIVSMSGYKTKIHQIMSKEHVSEMIDMESSVFFRFDEFTDI